VSEKIGRRKKVVQKNRTEEKKPFVQKNRTEKKLSEKIGRRKKFVRKNWTEEKKNFCPKKSDGEKKLSEKIGQRKKICPKKSDGGKKNFCPKKSDGEKKSCLPKLWNAASEADANWGLFFETSANIGGLQACQICIPKIPNLANFGGPWDAKSLNILWPSGIVEGHLA
jgi:hypothetical protein